MALKNCVTWLWWNTILCVDDKSAELASFYWNTFTWLGQFWWNFLKHIEFCEEWQRSREIINWSSFLSSSEIFSMNNFRRYLNRLSSTIKYCFDVQSSYVLSNTNYLLTSSNYQVRGTNYQLTSSNYQLPSTNYKLLSTNYLLPSTNYILPRSNFVTSLD